MVYKIENNWKSQVVYATGTNLNSQVVCHLKKKLKQWITI